MASNVQCRWSPASRVEVLTLLKLIAIAAGLILAARMFAERRGQQADWSPEPSERLSEEDVEQELRAE